MTDEELDNLLRSAVPPRETPMSFRAGVWRRIESQPPSLHSRFEQLFTKAFLPVPVAITTAVVLMFSVWLGNHSSSSSEESPHAYLESVSPFAAAKAHFR